MRDRSAILRRVSQSIAGFSTSRSLPKWREDTYRDRSDWRYATAEENAAAPEVVLFADTFNRYFERENLDDALNVLVAGGYRVYAPLPADPNERPLCCGRTFLSVGLVDEARKEMQRTLDALTPYVARGISVIGLEPSCLLTLRDELPALFPRVSAARKLAHNAMLLDEFLIAKAPLFSPPPLKGTALVHGHCHQKALAGMNSELVLLNKAEGLRVEAPDAGCCGMAGAFGYDASRFEVSRTIAERVLVPAVNQSAEDTLIIADGFACRSQIRQFCKGRHPMHLAQALNIKQEA